MDQEARKRQGDGEIAGDTAAEHRRGHPPFRLGRPSTPARPSLTADGPRGGKRARRMSDGAGLRPEAPASGMADRAPQGRGSRDRPDDGEAFAEREEERLTRIHEQLHAGPSRCQPARRVQIPTPGSTKKRNLGIPVVRDRIVSHSLHSVLEERDEPALTASNLGFRRGKRQHQAIGHVRPAVVEGSEWCAAIDLQGVVDAMPPALILRLMRRPIRDERVVTLIARALKAGVMVDGKIAKPPNGCPQGSPVSPMRSNIVLHELDHE